MILSLSLVEARPEKDARATFYAAIKRVLTEDDVVIADGMNYIKGYRYQLYCEAKAMETPSCVVHVGTPASKCKEWNNLILERHRNIKDSAEHTSSSTDTTKDNCQVVEPYDEDVIDNLIFRYEEPNGMTKWDSPLFVVPWTDEDVPGETIWEAMVHGKVVKPHQATVLVESKSFAH
jgi:protein KTI12